MSIGRSRLVAAALMGMLAVAERNNPEAKKVLLADDPPPEPKAAPEPSLVEARTQRVPVFQPPARTHNMKRQGERLARQKLDFSASDKCLARIRDRLGKFPSSGDSSREEFK